MIGDKMGSRSLALDEPTLSPRELAVHFTDTEKYFVSEASVYRLLKAHERRFSKWRENVGPARRVRARRTPSRRSARCATCSRRAGPYRLVAEFP